MFSEYPDFFKKFQEMGFSTTGEEGVRVRSYSYHGQHKTNHTENFIRFDFEPLKRKYPPIHINAHPQIWGDHLVYPDDTNLDISKMSCSLSFKIFYRYAKDPRDFPINKETNEPYREFFDEEENGYART
ncbi:hypothetical protein NM897_09685 [Planococcus maritimus]|uniref:hypothetical protein n=1 Tax=Planococcus maritimus TaxID=192421 RepID=UPI0031387A19